MSGSPHWAQWINTPFGLFGRGFFHVYAIFSRISTLFGRLRSVAPAGLRRAPPKTLAEMKATMQEFADSMDCGEVFQAMRHLRGKPKKCDDDDDDCSLRAGRQPKKCIELQGAVLEPFY